jgi:SAM-dependent methyltransferase
MHRFLALLLMLVAAPAATQDLDVPYVPTPEAVVERMMALGEVGPGTYLIDLGSGDGRIALAAARRGARALGVDLDPVRVAEAQAAARLEGLEGNARFRRQDLFDTPLREADVVTLYLLPDVNLRLRPRLLTELRPGTRILSHNFDMGEWRPDAEEEIGASHLFLWVVPAVVGGAWTMNLADGAILPLEIEQSFQQASGTLGGAALTHVRLSGTAFRFTAGGRRFHGLVGDAAITPDPDSPEQGWIARRAE